jgi:hypothetical protein
MVTYKNLSKTLALLALTVMVLGQPIQLMAAAPIAKAFVEQKTVDIALRGQNELYGRVVDTQGQPTPGATVILADIHNVSLASTNADPQGRFAFAGVPTGHVVLQVGDSQTQMRTWAAKTAPPAAQQEVLLTTSSPTVRGQYGGLGATGTTILAAWGVALGIGIYEGVKDTGS